MNKEILELLLKDSMKKLIDQTSNTCIDELQIDARRYADESYGNFSEKCKAILGKPYHYPYFVGILKAHMDSINKQCLYMSNIINQLISK